MITETAFGHTLVKTHCTDTNIYRNPDLTRAVTDVFNIPPIKHRIRGLKEDSHLGPGFTSVGNDYVSIVYLPGAKDITQWVADQMLAAKDLLGIDKPGTKVKFKRSWANRLFKGAQGSCHQHVKVDQYIAELTDYTNINFRPDIVGIFYVDVPENSSDLVVIEHGREFTVHSDYPEEEKYYIKPAEGMLIMHKPEVWHAVTEHQNDLPRNCFVFDADFIE